MDRLLPLLAALLLAALAGDDAAAAAADADAELLVRTPLGPVRGTLSLGGQARAFLGVRYARPPGRWEAPQPAVAHGPAVFNATEFGAGCVQKCGEPAHTCPATTSEDCLFANVYTPRAAGRNASSAPAWPVVVFLHGGDFVDGCGGTRQDGVGPLYSGRFLANATDTVLVTLNYRLGVMGFLASAHGLGGNYGILDQQMALRWVQQNIAAFGGDPARVTLMGQSAGAVSTMVHTVAPSSAGLFHQAAVVSELLALPLRSPAEAHAMGAAFANFSGCAADDLACLRALTPAQVLDGQHHLTSDVGLDSRHFLEAFMPFGPVAGSALLPEQPYTAVVSGRARRVPLLIGNVRNEGNLFVGLGFGKPVSPLEYEIILGVVTGNLSAAARVGAMYPAPPAGGDARPQMANVTDDAVFFCSTRNASWALAAQGAPVYRYVFDHVASFAPKLWGPGQKYCWHETCHGQDLAWWFSPFLEYEGYLSWTQDEYRLAHAMGRSLGNFAHTGDPNRGPGGAPAVAWPRYARAADTVRRLGTSGAALVTGFHHEQCALMDTIGYPMP